MKKEENKAIDQHQEQQAVVELKDKLVHVMRTSKVVKGGRIFNFTAVVVVGSQGRVGFGIGKASEVPAAIKKATDVARMNIVEIALHGTTVQYDAIGKHGASQVFIRPASEGTGVIAGGPMRAIFEVLGVENVLAKTVGSGSPINVMMATMDALTRMENPKQVALRRGLSVKRVLGIKEEKEAKHA